jgi:hypothetical protein
VPLTDVAQARPLRCILPTSQIQEAYFAVHTQAWSECDCLNAASARVFRRCYREAVRRLGANRGLTEGCIRELSGPLAVRSTCGRPKAVVCCTTKRVFNYIQDNCAVRRSARECVATRGNTACIKVGQQSCFDAAGADSNCGCLE